MLAVGRHPGVLRNSEGIKPLTNMFRVAFPEGFMTIEGMIIGLDHHTPSSL